MLTFSTLSRFAAKTSMISLATVMGCATASCDVGTPFKSEQKLEMNVAREVTQFKITNVVGDIELSADAAATGVSAEIVKTGKGATQAEADAALAEISVTMAPGQADGSVEAIVTQPKGGHHREYGVKWKITLPPTAQVTVVNRVGDITIQGSLKGVAVSNDVGDIDAKSVAGGVDVSTRVGDVFASGEGAVASKSDVGNVTVEVAAGAESLKATSRVGDVNVTIPRAWTGTVKATNNVGDLELQSQDFSVSEVKKSRGRCEAKLNGGGAGSLEASTQVGDVTIRSAG